MVAEIIPRQILETRRGTDVSTDFFLPLSLLSLCRIEVDTLIFSFDQRALSFFYAIFHLPAIQPQIFSQMDRDGDCSNLSDQLPPSIPCSTVPTICSGQWTSFKLDLASDQFRVDRGPVHVSPIGREGEKEGKKGNGARK